MNKYLAARMRIASILMAAALGTSAFVAPQSAQAQSTPEKIQLMAETLRARDSGNLNLAQQKAEELIKVAPNDQNVQRLLASINQEVERRSGGSAVYGQAASIPVTPTAAVSVGGAEAAIATVAADQDIKIAAAESAIADAAKLADLGAYDDATALLNSAADTLDLNLATAEVLSEIDEAKTEVVLAEAGALSEAGDLLAAEERLEEYYRNGGRSKKAVKLANKIKGQISDPYALSISEISPEYVEQSKVVRDLLARGRAQFLNNDFDGAAATFKEVEARDALNVEAKLFQTKIAEEVQRIHSQNRYKTREQLLAEVEQNWDRPKVFAAGTGPGPVTSVTGLQDRIEGIVIPQINFSGIELTRVIETLSELSYEYGVNGEGVNIIPLFNATEQGGNPKVSISLRNLNLDKILQFVTQQVGYSYDVGEDAITIQPTGDIGGNLNTVTEFFPISRATRIRITGLRDGGGGSSGPVDPFAAPAGGGGASGPSADEETEALQSFFQRAGVNFDIPGASLAFDGEQLIVTQTRRNLERLRTILRNYNEVKQVEIESKFLEVTQGNLDELGFDWAIGGGDQPGIFSTQNRTVAGAFGTDPESSSISISQPASVLFDADTGVPILTTSELNTAVPVLPPAVDLGSDLGETAGDLFSAVGLSISGANVDFAIRALASKTGSDLMSAPKVTVLSGKRANIVVAQEIRYPESYGDIESTVSSNENGGAAISITAGTPQDFVTRNVGVEMAVTPNVENDDTISLILEPRVTEFEGFVEYGGPSVAIADETVATVPAGFFQPIFSTREITTEVTVFDGATVVMGGLTRDEIRTVNDKVPFLGDIPGVGRLFRSEGESREKRNLLIFVTANLVSPGGSPARQNYRNVDANSLFQNPTIVTPSGAANRSIPSDEQ